MYAKVFSLSARNNTGPGHYVENAGRMYKITNEYYDYIFPDVPMP